MGMQTTCGKAILLLMTLAHASAQTSVVSRAGWTGLENVYQTDMDTCCHAQRKRNTFYSIVPAEELEMYIGYVRLRPELQTCRNKSQVDMKQT